MGHLPVHADFAELAGRHGYAPAVQPNIEASDCIWPAATDMRTESCLADSPTAARKKLLIVPVAATSPTLPEYLINPEELPKPTTKLCAEELASDHGRRLRRPKHRLQA